MTQPSNPYPTLPRGIDPSVVRSIRQASQTSSTDFGLLMAQASQESDFRSDAKSSTSSATGLFQFVDSTWLDMVQRFGAKYGIGQLAQQISTDSAGKPVVSDPATRQQILALRNDPSLSASLAGEYTKLNKTQVEQALGHPASRADLYMAHFLGAGGATTFLKTMATKGSTVAADLLPGAAAANQSIFYDAQTGQARTVAEIYKKLGTSIDNAAAKLGGASTASPPATGTSALAALLPFGQQPAFGGMKLSDTVMSMLNVIAMAALKLSNDGPSASTTPSPLPLTQPRGSRSL